MPPLGYLLHQVAPAAEDAHRETAADDLAKSRKIGLDARAPALRPEQPEAGDDLVEDEQNIVLAG